MTHHYVLGVSCDYHDAAAALVADGRVVAAAEEERFTRIKHDNSLPANAIASCLASAGVRPDDLDSVVMYEKPLSVMARVLAARQRRGPAAVGTFVGEFPVLLERNAMVAYRLERELRRLGATRNVPVRYGEHHLSHACAAFLPSPFETAAILAVDGVGEWSTATIGHGLRHRVDQLVEQRYPHSLGLLYSLATAWCGFQPNDGEYKLMGLAPFGAPTYRATLDELVDIHDDGSITVDAAELRWWSSDPARMQHMTQRLGGPPRGADEPLEQRHADIARSIQELVEIAVSRMARHAHRLTGERNLCLAGGVALNCVANGRLLREGPFEQIWVQPAPGDSGSAIGAALWHWHNEPGALRTLPRRDSSEDVTVDDGMANSHLGPRFGGDEVASWLGELGVDHRRITDTEDLCEHVAQRLDEGAIVGWFQGRMEFGPRALGNRSILADPRSSTVHRDLNLRVKGRESFRPFAPAVLWEHAKDWFEIDRPSRYMSFVVPVAKHRMIVIGDEPAGFRERAQAVRSEIPACTHVDGTARVQTVHVETTPLFHALLSAFQRRTGCPVLVNTSFNLAGEPIVCTPEDALDSARRGGMDLLVIGDAVIELDAGERTEFGD
jgi:carbamoyltransferase